MLQRVIDDVYHFMARIQTEKIWQFCTSVSVFYVRDMYFLSHSFFVFLYHILHGMHSARALSSISVTEIQSCTTFRWCFHLSASLMTGLWIINGKREISEESSTVLLWTNNKRTCKCLFTLVRKALILPTPLIDYLLQFSFAECACYLIQFAIILNTKRFFKCNMTSKRHKSLALLFFK